MLHQNLNRLKYIYKLLDELQAKKYHAVATNNIYPVYKIKNLDANNHTEFYYHAKTAIDENRANALAIVCINQLIALDIDKKHEYDFFKSLSTKHKIKSNLVVATQNGYHVYFRANYTVSAQNSSNNQIAIKCNCMPITAPSSYRYDKSHKYTVITQNGYIPPLNELILMPLEMYQELKKFNHPCKNECVDRGNIPVPTSSAPAECMRGKNKFNDKPISYYLDRIDKNKYLYSDMASWLYVLASCKKANPSSFSDAFKWSKQGKYSSMSNSEFLKFWNYADAEQLEIRNPFAFLESRSICK